MFPLSPSVNITEQDFTNIVPAVATSTGAFAGVFEWGPVLDPITITSEEVLAQTFGHPNDSNFTSWFSAANFLAYSNNLLVNRAQTAGMRNAVTTQTGSVVSVTITNAGSGYTSAPTVTFSVPQIAGGTRATGTAVLSGGTVSGATVANKGAGYTSANVVFSAPENIGGITAIGSPVLSGYVSGYSVTGGTGYSSAPPLTFSAPQIAGGVTATATATVSGGAITGITITNPGSGYTSAPTVTVGGAGTGGAVTPTITLDKVESITITNAGSGYLNAPSVTIYGTGAGATATAAVTASTISSILITEHGSGYTSAPTVALTGGAGSNFAGTPVITTAGVKIKNTQEYLDKYSAGTSLVGEFAAKYPGTLGNSLTVSMADSATFASWAYAGNFTSAPGTSSYASSIAATNDELHVVVIDSSGLWTGTPGTVLEKFAFVSKIAGAQKPDGSNNYYKDVINSTSSSIWWTAHPTGMNWGTVAQGTTLSSLGSVVTRALSGGADDYNATDGNIQEAYSVFTNQEAYDISLLISGKVSPVTANYIISNVAETRKDLVAFFSPVNIADNSVIIGKGSTVVSAINAFRNALPSSSYAFLDSGFKYQYDRYNDKYRWIPLNGDIAGLAARTDYTNDAWWSFAGYNRGQIKNWVKLSTQLGRTERDNLYVNGVNPVIIEPGQGCILFGDKTLQAKPSAFDRVNVRRLFIVLEKAISKAAKYQLFEFNDEFTRAAFVNMVTPFLRDVQGRRGLEKFVVKCDSSNNTQQVISSNQFVGDIYVMPNYSINFIQLNFIASNNFAQFNVTGA